MWGQKQEVPGTSQGPLCATYGFAPQYVQESILFSLCIAVVCEVLNSFLLPAIIAKLWPADALPLSEMQKNGMTRGQDMAGRLLGTIHALVVLFGATYATFLDAEILANPLSGASMPWKTVRSGRRPRIGAAVPPRPVPMRAHALPRRCSRARRWARLRRATLCGICRSAHENLSRTACRS